jgi:hypothetical protein
MSVSVRGANRPVRILATNGQPSNKSNPSARFLAWLRAFYFAHRKPNKAFVEADPDVPI